MDAAHTGSLAGGPLDGLRPAAAPAILRRSAYRQPISVFELTGPLNPRTCPA